MALLLSKHKKLQDSCNKSMEDNSEAKSQEDNSKAKSQEDNSKL